VGFRAEKIHLGLYGGNLASPLRAKQDTENTCDGQPGPRCQLSPLLLVNQDPVRIQFSRQGNRLGLSSMELHQEKAKQARILRRANLDPLSSNGILNCLPRCGVRVGNQFFSYAKRYPNLGELRLQEFETTNRGEV